MGFRARVLVENVFSAVPTGEELGLEDGNAYHCSPRSGFVTDHLSSSGYPHTKYSSLVVLAAVVRDIVQSSQAIGQTGNLFEEPGYERILGCVLLNLLLHRTMTELLPIEQVDSLLSLQDRGRALRSLERRQHRVSVM